MKKPVLVAGLLVAPALLCFAPALLCFAQANSPASATPSLPAPVPQMPAQPNPALPPISLQPGASSLTNPVTFSSNTSETAPMSRIERHLKPETPAYYNGLAPKTA